MIRITPDVRNQLCAHALRERPNEACGMVSAAPDLPLVDMFHPMRNAADSARIFELDGQEMLDLERSVEGAGRELVGVVHSHTETSAYPSATDVRDSARFDPFGTYVHLIVSLRHPEPVLRCYRIVGETITELPVVVTEGDDDLRDEGGAVAVAAVMQFRTRD